MPNARSLVRRRVRVATTFTLTVLLLILGTPSVAPADDTPHPTLRGFVRTGKYALQVQNRIVPAAEIYHSAGAAAFLLLQTGYESPLLVLPSTSSVHSVKFEDILALEDGSRALKSTAVTTKVGTYRRDRRRTTIRVSNWTAAMIANPPLLKWHGAERLIQHTPEYGRDAETYAANASTIRALARREAKIQVYVYFGSWCHTCSRFLGKIIRVEQELLGGGVTFRYYGLPKPPAMYRDAEVRQRGIRKLPTGLVYAGSRYLGSIVSTDWNHPEQALERLVSTALGN